MSINLDFKKNKVDASYKTIYLKNEIIEVIEDLAKKHDTSFNNVVVNMLEYCLKKDFKA